jgi:hypothetical protein
MEFPMFRKLIVTLVATLCTGAALAQTTNNAAVENAAKTSSPVAYVYVARPTHLDGFAASSNGKLTAVPGSPFTNISLTHMSVTKKYLFGADSDGQDLDTFSIGSNGALKEVAQINAQNYNSDNCGGQGVITLDYTGTTLYNIVNFDCEDAIQSFKINSNGELGYLGSADSQLPADLIDLGFPEFVGTNKFAYQIGSGGDGTNDPYMVRYKRESNGLLAFDGQVTGLPKTKDPQDYYLPFAYAGDPSDHFAMALQEFDPIAGEFVGPFEFGSFSVNSSGEIESKSTYENMPSTKLAYISTMSISPNGKMLAAGSVYGFQVFHFNGSSPITKLSSVLLSGKVVSQFGWDKDNHLYVLTSDSLHVYEVSSSSVKEVSGSPYSIPEAASLIVLSM